MTGGVSRWGAAPPAGDDPHAPSRRVFAEFPLLFIPRGALASGIQRSSQLASTHNLSNSGLFIATETILPPGSRLSIELRMPGVPERLEGVVIWGRYEPASGRVRGMGVQLLAPSSSYRARVQILR